MLATPCTTRLICSLTLIGAMGWIGSQPSLAHDGITMASWGGAYTRSQMLAYVKPFREETTQHMFVVDYNGGLDEIRAQVDSANVTWDVVSLQLSDAVLGCEEDLLEKLDLSMLPPAPDGTAAEDDFRPGTLVQCAIGDILWSTVAAYNEDRFSKERPETLADFFDLQRFPGKRGLRMTPQVNLEWALMADGVAPEQVYETLSSEAGIQRAFKSLDKIRLQTVWWESGSDPVRLLESGTVAMTSAYNGRLYDAVQRRDHNVFTIWDGQVLDINLWAIPKGSDHVEEALEFIRYATDTERQAQQALYISYGPARASAMAIINDDVKPHLPTAPENLSNALIFDAQWWAEHQQQMDQRFAEWLGLTEITPIVGYE